MDSRWNVRVAGPLAPYAASFAQRLREQGYRSAGPHMYLMAQLSSWLLDTEQSVADLSGSQLETFGTWRRARGYVSAVSSFRFFQLVDYLASVGATAVTMTPATPSTATEALMGRYRSYLVVERGLAAPTVRAYAEVAAAFLSWLSAEDELDLEAVTTAEVTRFVLAECARLKVSSAKATTTRLRSLLRFLYVEALIARPLADAVPSVASWRLGSLPRALPAGDLTRMLKSCDRRRPLGRRDFAVLSLLWRLGLRAGEVAALQLHDIAWRAGELTIRGKGNRSDRLPLPVEVGEAIAVWLERGRPACEATSVFVHARAPHRALSPGGVSMIVRRACGRAGVAPAGAHRLRHSAATDMLRAGGSLDEVGQVLRHRRRETTQLYAKVDRRALSAVVRPWPEARP